MAKMSATEKPPRKTFSPTFIKAWRLYREVSQGDLAKSMGVTGGNVSQLEHGLIGYTQASLEAAAKALGVHPADLLTRKPPKKRQ
jgi:transcriptional regulator with XRE-family HTH domain